MTSRTTPTGKTLSLVKGGKSTPEHWTVAAAKLAGEVLARAADDIPKGHYDMVVLTIGDLANNEIELHSTLDDPGDLMLVARALDDFIDDLR